MGMEEEQGQTKHHPRASSLGLPRLCWEKVDKQPGREARSGRGGGLWSPKLTSQPTFAFSKMLNREDRKMPGSLRSRHWTRFLLTCGLGCALETKDGIGRWVTRYNEAMDEQGGGWEGDEIGESDLICGQGKKKKPEQNDQGILIVYKS